MTPEGRQTSGRAPLTFSIPDGTPKRSCMSCGAAIYWIETARGKRMPVNPDGVSHFATCKDASTWRRPR